MHHKKKKEVEEKLSTGEVTEFKIEVPRFDVLTFGVLGPKGCIVFDMTNEEGKVTSEGWNILSAKNDDMCRDVFGSQSRNANTRYSKLLGSMLISGNNASIASETLYPDDVYDAAPYPNFVAKGFVEPI